MHVTLKWHKLTALYWLDQIKSMEHLKDIKKSTATLGQEQENKQSERYFQCL